jgi:adenylate cyclase class 2
MPPKRKPASSPVETEAKIRVASLPAVKKRLKAQGGRLLNARTFEANTLFDAPGGALRLSGRSFRVRSYGASGSVTLKGAARVFGGMKSREELETHVASPEILSRILHGLGFVPTFRYEKYREVWGMGSTVVCLDETPLGPFVEIEGASSAIFRVAKSLGLEASDFLSDSYPALWFGAGRSDAMVFKETSRGEKGTRRRATRAGKRA